MLRPYKLAAIAACSLVVGTSMAETTSSPMNVSATVGAGGTCQLTTYPVDFGTVDSGGAQVATQVDVNCSAGTNFSLSFDAGLHYDAGLAFRQVQNPAGDTIIYGIVVNGSGVEVGDDCAANTYPAGSCLVGSGTGIVESLILDAILTDAGSQVTNVYTAGTSYSDQVNVILEF